MSEILWFNGSVAVALWWFVLISWPGKQNQQRCSHGSLWLDDDDVRNFDGANWLAGNNDMNDNCDDGDVGTDDYDNESNDDDDGDDDDDDDVRTD